MTQKPTYEELELRVQELEKSELELKHTGIVLREVRTFLGDQLKLILNPRSTFLNSRLNGLSFLGFRIFPNVIRVKRENLKRVKGKLKEKKKEFHAGLITEDRFVMSVRSMFYHLSFANSFHLRSSVFVPRADVG